ncbi:hypothetical protein AYJ54_05330 [Bradyrhizobium centrolobii]|uniref:Uncharacterized protein n=1 Tax=Bradyrhizobium centrolobii TaxID=1505087 RepID=A0A176Z9Y2_9BRAD|nr:hypothetical protein AYJ54_05330 [Bradyrhizobium centrolobii]
MTFARIDSEIIGASAFGDLRVADWLMRLTHSFKRHCPRASPLSSSEFAKLPSAARSVSASAPGFLLIPITFRVVADTSEFGDAIRYRQPAIPAARLVQVQT